MKSVVSPAAMALMLFAASLAIASKVASNRPYVQSGPDRLGSGLYARCIPKAKEGTAGRTEIFRVGEDGDQLIDRYDWFAPSGLLLGWSPIKGKVAVLGVMRWGFAAADWKEREQLRFGLGGLDLASYTSADLIEMGAQQSGTSADGLHAGYRVVGCEQVPGTNEYDFVIEVAGGKLLKFDITTGRLRPATTTTQPAARAPAGPASRSVDRAQADYTAVSISALPVNWHATVMRDGSGNALHGSHAVDQATFPPGTIDLPGILARIEPHLLSERPKPGFDEELYEFRLDHDDETIKVCYAVDPAPAAIVFEETGKAYEAGRVQEALRTSFRKSWNEHLPTRLNETLWPAPPLDPQVHH